MKGVSVAALCLVLAGCQAPGEEGAAAPYALADDNAGSVMLAPGVVSSEAPEFATTLSPDGRTVYFNRASGDRSVLRIFESNFIDSTWTEPVPLPFSDGAYRDIDPFLSIDGERLFFSSDRRVNTNGSKDFDIWYVERTDTGWSAPVNPGAPLNGSGHEVFVSETRSGTLYFSLSGTSGGERGIVRAKRGGSGYAAPEPVHFDVPDSIRLGNPAIAPDESFIVLTHGSPDGSVVDLFISWRQADGSFGTPQEMPTRVNSEWMDFAPYITRDQRYLFFTSERPGIVDENVEGRRPGDIYRTRLPDR